MKNKFMVSLSVCLLVLLLFSCNNKYDSGKAAYLGQGLQQSIMVRNMIAEYYAMNDELPHSNEQLGLSASGEYSNNVLMDLTVGGNGMIILTYQDGGVLTFTPNTTNRAQGVRWSCATSSYDDVVPWCDYTP